MPRLIAPLLLSLFATSLAPAQTARRVRDVIYLKEGGAAFTLDVFQPRRPNGAAIVFLISSGWDSDHSFMREDLAREANARGFVFVEVVHGTQPRYKVPEIVGQVARAVRFVRQHARKYGYRPNRIGLFGASAGGHLSLMVAATAADGPADAKDPVDRQSSAAQAVAAFSPPTDFTNWGQPGGTAFAIPFLRATFGNAFVADQETAPSEQIVELSRQYSPALRFTAAMPPTLLVHGDKDALRWFRCSSPSSPWSA